MAELHIIGQILSASEFIEPNLFCRWSLQFGTNWKLIEGTIEGQTVTCRGRISNTVDFSHPIDIHLACRGIQGWPKIHVEIYAVNALNHFFPVGFGFAHCPTQPGFHKIEISTWKIGANNWIDHLNNRFSTGGLTLSKSDLAYSGVERYKLTTISSGLVIVDVMVICKNFQNFGIEF